MQYAPSTVLRMQYSEYAHNLVCLGVQSVPGTGTGTFGIV
jgi:hypothetical protein